MSSLLSDTAVDKSRKIVNVFNEQGKSMFIGVPCGILKNLFLEIETSKGLVYAPREDNAIAMACGAHMAGEKPLVLMQNSGFAQSLNVLASLVIPFNIPITMIISLRGTGIDNTPENQVMGSMTHSMLDDLGITYRTLKEDSYLSDLEWAKTRTEIYNEPVALLITPEFFDWRPSE
ncbi:hypothetical protein [Priestia megaterium]|uniref:hypothetical protein n=1 Tax=Priestia megaterium TaxID=1404 RepID=UPI0010CD20FE|nr:hypothetical protein [Priestia megaterium]QCR30479.1 hypothetical protein C1N54_26950 [Priestia megaterium]